jgi:hypothetical protein
VSANPAFSQLNISTGHGWEDNIEIIIKTVNISPYQAKEAYRVVRC